VLLLLTAIKFAAVMGSVVCSLPNLRGNEIYWQENAWNLFEYLGVNGRIILK
jgi:hypothetical protein